MPQHQNHQASPNSKTRRPRIPSIIHNVKQQARPETAHARSAERICPHHHSL